jgi:predicted negative regulator of RcsB-dependent stress response
MIAEENSDGAEVLLNQAVKGTPFDPLSIELRGDIAVARGELVAANKAYQEALALTDASSAGYHLLQLKFDNTGVGEVPE